MKMRLTSVRFHASTSIHVPHYHCLDRIGEFEAEQRVHQRKGDTSRSDVSRGKKPKYYLEKYYLESYLLTRSSR